jgi:hypothetical protein
MNFFENNRIYNLHLEYTLEKLLYIKIISGYKFHRCRTTCIINDVLYSRFSWFLLHDDKKISSFILVLQDAISILNGELIKSLHTRARHGAIFHLLIGGAAARARHSSSTHVCQIIYLFYQLLHR